MDPCATPSVSSASASARVSSRSKITDRPRKVRSACDRCHTQKLGCVRKLGEVSCERCLKLRKSCQYGPRAPRASLKPPEPGAWHEMPSVTTSISMPNVDLDARIAEGSNSDWLLSPGIGAEIAEDQAADPNLCYLMQADGLDMPNLWSDPFCELGVINPLDRYGFPKMDLISQQQLHATFPLADTHTYPKVDEHNANDHLEISPTSVVYRLANLNVALYECSANLPFRPEAGINAAGITSHGSGSRKEKLFAIDEHFRLTSEFIDIIKSLSPQTGSSLSSRDQGVQALPVVEYARQLSSTSQTVTRTAAPSTSFSHIDEGTMLIIMSCHCRLTETYLSIFQMTQACIECSAVPQMDKDAAIILPRLQVGSHASPQVRVDASTTLEPGTSGMYMLLVTMLSGQLCEKLADVMGVGGEVPIGSRSASQCLFAATVTERTDRLRRTIDATKRLLQRFPLV